MRETSSLFALNNSVTKASAVVSLTNADSITGLTVDTQSLVAIDYTNCSGCTNGLLYSRHADMLIQNYSMLRVSHGVISDVASGTALINVVSPNAVAVYKHSLLVVENVSAAANAIFNASAVNTGERSAAVLRYVTASAVGATMDGGATYKLLSLSGSLSSAALSAAVPGGG